MSSACGPDQGSVLVDTLVAIAIMSLTLVLAAHAVGDGARRTRAAEASGLETLEARSRMAEVGADIPLQPGRDSGEDGALDWQVEIAPAPGPGVQIRAADGCKCPGLNRRRTRP